MLTFNANPILKWAGGKQSLAPKLVSYFPRQFERYYEPFVGGQAFSFVCTPPVLSLGT